MPITKTIYTINEHSYTQLKPCIAVPINYMEQEIIRNLQQITNSSLNLNFTNKMKITQSHGVLSAQRKHELITEHEKG